MLARYVPLVSMFMALGTLSFMGQTASASVAPPAGTYYGQNLTSCRYYFDNYAGARAGYWVNSYSPGYSYNFSFGAFDPVKDGLSVRTVAYVQQFYSGAWRNTNTITVTNSSGYGYGRVAGGYNIYRVSGASQIRIVLYSYTYDLPSNTYRSSASRVVGTQAW